MSDLWLTTRSGIHFDLTSPTIDMISWYDIAASLSKICRFGGHCERFYSVAEHCLHVARLVPDDLAAYGLLHDAHEAYIGDMISPLKRLVSESPIKDLEILLDRLIYEKAGLFFPNDAIHTAVREADLRMLATERRDLFPGYKATRPWIIDTEEVEPVDFSLCLWSSGLACGLWLDALQKYVPQTGPEVFIP